VVLPELVFEAGAQAVMADQNGSNIRDRAWPWPIYHGSKRVASAGRILAKVASEKWIPWLPQKNPARHDRDYVNH